MTIPERAQRDPKNHRSGPKTNGSAIYLYDLLSQLRLFTQAEPDYFADVGIGDLGSVSKLV